jgi:hypothetical protein
VSEDRGTLGHGRAVGVADIAPAARLSLLVGAASALLATGVRAVPLKTQRQFVRPGRFRGRDANCVFIFREDP